MTTTTRQRDLLLRFRPKEARHAVTRKTLRRISTRLGVSETEAVHYAVAALRDRLLPAYPQDDGPVTRSEIRALRKRVSQKGYKPTETILPGL